MSRLWLALGSIVVGACHGASAADTDAPVTPPRAAAEDSTPSTQEGIILHQLFAQAWEFSLEEGPLFATSVGDHRADDRLPVVTAEANARRIKFWRDVLGRVDQIDRARLSRSDQINLEVFRGEVAHYVASYEFGAHEMGLTTDSGFHIDFASLPSRMPFDSAQGYENYIARLRDFPRYAAESTELLRAGLRRQMVLPKVVLQGYDVTISSHVVSDASKSVFWAPFERIPATFAASERERLRARGKAAILEAIVPAYQRFLAFMNDEYIRGARPSLGASALPNGDAYYRHLVHYFTTLDGSPDDIHEVGLSEVARIRAEMETVMRSTGFGGSFAEFLEFLRTDPQFYATSPEALLKEASYIAKRMDAKLPSLFGHLPRVPYGVAPVPDHLAPKYTTGRYVDPALGSTEPGYYWVNTYALESRPLYALEALTLHEAVPGHHLQISLARELESLPKFRRFLYLSAFGEGWALYAEWLGLEAGFYTDPYSNFGRLTYEMWRACRLVVDTGLHSKGWTRTQAIDYMASRTALSLHNIENEVDRYISWPGQALAYKMGELTVRRLRRHAEQRLGELFNVRDFHDVVLKNGAIPLPLLEEEVARYVNETRLGHNPTDLKP